jgi:hypothetical protein
MAPVGETSVASSVGASVTRNFGLTGKSLGTAAAVPAVIGTGVLAYMLGKKLASGGDRNHPLSYASSAQLAGYLGFGGGAAIAGLGVMSLKEVSKRNTANAVNEALESAAELIAVKHKAAAGIIVQHADSIVESSAAKRAPLLAAVSVVSAGVAGVIGTAWAINTSHARVEQTKTDVHLTGDVEVEVNHFSGTVGGAADAGGDVVGGIKDGVAAGLDKINPFGD